MQPGTVAFAKVFHQPGQVALSQVANRLDAVGLELVVSLGPNAVDLAAGQWPDQALQILFLHDGNAVGLVELAGHFGDQFVGRYADRAGQSRGVKNAFLDQTRQHPPTFALAAGHIRKVDVDLVHPPVLHEWCNVGNHSLEGA